MTTLASYYALIYWKSRTYMEVANSKYNERGDEADRLDTLTKSTWHGIIDSLRSEIYDIEAVVNAFHEAQKQA